MQQQNRSFQSTSSSLLLFSRYIHLTFMSHAMSMVNDVYFKTRCLHNLCCALFEGHRLAKVYQNVHVIHLLPLKRSQKLSNKRLYVH